MIEQNEEILRFHMDTLSAFSANMYETLIQEWHIVSGNLKEVEFVGEDDMHRGYFAQKDKKKYFIGENMVKGLPVRVIEDREMKYGKEDIVYQPTKVATFKIVAEDSMSMKEYIDMFMPVSHSNLKHWLLLKLIATAGYIGKTFVCVSSEPAFGKSSIYSVLHALTDKCPVFKPRSIPGCLNKITGVGNMVFDEAHESQKEVRDVMEEVTLVLGGGATTYINGALKAAKTKNKYQCPLQSITYLYNNVSCYKEPEKRYFEVIFKNNQAMDDRLLKVRLKGRMTQRWTRDFDIVGIADRNKMYYLSLAKQLAYWQKYKQTGKYQKKFVSHNSLRLEGRQKLVFNEIDWVIDQYSQSQEEYDGWVKLLETAITDYKSMISCLDDNKDNRIREEELIR